MATSERARVSRFGQYDGYSEPTYDGWQRSSAYVTARDGTRLAVDWFRPTRSGELHQEPLPVVWAHCQYKRALFTASGMYTVLDYLPHLHRLVQHGFIIGISDARGTGASFGAQFMPFSPDEARDGHDVTEWFAAQPWCNGKVGMFWHSFMGMSQHFAAAEAPPHLTAVFPEMCGLDTYDVTYPGGIFHGGVFGRDMLGMRFDMTQTLPENWLEQREARRSGPVDRSREDGVGAFSGPPDWSFNDAVVPVDEDTDASIVAEALAQQVQPDVAGAFEDAPFRDSVLPGRETSLYHERSLYARLERIREASIPAYHLSGWFDCAVRNLAALLRNYHPAQKVMIGPWFHTSRDCRLLSIEQHRWFDYWLKGVENGIMDEPPVHYWTIGRPDGEAWRSAPSWPIDTHRTDHFLRAEVADSIDSANDGSLSTEPPAPEPASTPYTTDYGVTVGFNNRWTNTGLPCETQYDDLKEHNRRGLTFTSPVLEAAVEITGQPTAHLWVSSEAADGDFFLYLTDVAEDGSSTYLSEGELRASLRSLGEAPYDIGDLPFHPSRQQDAAPLAPGEAVELVMEMEPISALVPAGHRLRVTVTGAHEGSFHTPRLDPAPVVAIHHDAHHPSRVVLPIAEG